MEFPGPAFSWTMNFVAETPARSTRAALTSKPETERLPRAFFNSSSGKPASRNAPSTMSPEIPEKQSKKSTRDIYRSHTVVSPTRYARPATISCARTSRIQRPRGLGPLLPHARQGRRLPTRPTESPAPRMTVRLPAFALRPGLAVAPQQTAGAEAERRRSMVTFHRRRALRDNAHDRAGGDARCSGRATATS